MVNNLANLDSHRHVKPIFIISLPRSGSTLLQRILASHENISTASEPSFLLPLVYSIRKSGIYTEYAHSVTVSGLEDLFKLIPNEIYGYYKVLRNAAYELYTSVSEEKTRYFVDKTPRYHFILQDLIRMFPDDKFIFLCRNPISVLASISQTFGNGKWRMYAFEKDLFEGLPNIIDIYKKNINRFCSVNYENIIKKPEEELKKVFEYLEIDFDKNIINTFYNNKLNGRLGDKNISLYSSLSDKPIIKWKNVICNPYRKRWCKKYLNFIGQQRLQTIGYDINSLMSDLDNNSYSLKYMYLDIVYIFLDSYINGASLI